MSGITTIGRCLGQSVHGRIQYLDDCTHHLKGQTIDLPDWDTSWVNW